MSEVSRFGVSLENSLLERLDELCQRRRYASRSEALRDMIRTTLSEDALADDDSQAAGVLTMVYDHHRPDLPQTLTERQHEAGELIISALHVHLDAYHCLETLILKGRARDIRKLAGQLRAIKGVSLGSLSLTALLPDDRAHHHDTGYEEPHQHCYTCHAGRVCQSATEATT